MPPELEVDDELDDVELPDDELLEDEELFDDELLEELLDDELLEELDDELLELVVVPEHAVNKEVSVTPTRMPCQFMASTPRINLHKK